MHQNLKTIILWHSAFFKVQLSDLYMTAGNTIVWLYGSLFAEWCLYLLIHYLSLLWLSFQGVSFNTMTAVTFYRDFANQENKICYYLHFSPFCFPWSDGTFGMLNFKSIFHSLFSPSSSLPTQCISEPPCLETNLFFFF